MRRTGLDDPERAALETSPDVKTREVLGEEGVGVCSRVGSPGGVVGDGWLFVPC